MREEDDIFFALDDLRCENTQGRGGKGEDSDPFAPISDIDSIFSDNVALSYKSNVQPVPLQEVSSNAIDIDIFRSIFNQPESTYYSHPGDTSELLNKVAESLDGLDNILTEPVSYASTYGSQNNPPRPPESVPKAPPTFQHLRPSLPLKRQVTEEKAEDTARTHQAKRQRTNEKSDSEESEDVDARFRFFQAEKWLTKFHELIEYKKVHGHCQVPHGYKPNPALARWTKRQRYQYKLFQDNKSSTMTEERISSLEDLGFVWDSHSALWQERYNELQQFCQVLGHSNVPSTYPPNPKLAIWVKCQRRQYKLLCNGQPSNMTNERVKLLNRLKFVWEVRRVVP